MLTLHPYLPSDAELVLAWCREKKEFYLWSAGVLGEYPLAAENLHFPMDAEAFLMHDETGAAGFFILRKTEEKEYRIGFVIIDPKKRGLGYGKKMMRLAAEYAFEKGAEAVSLAVFENNKRAMHCYESAGFLPVDGRESYVVLGEKWYCRRMRLKKEDEQ